jgi:hypothetical protein
MDVLDNPALPHPVNPPVADHADAGASLPHLKPSMGSKLSAGCRAQIHNLDECHDTPPSQVKSWGGMIVTAGSLIIVTKVGDDSLKQILPLRTQGFTGGDQV